MATSYIGYQSKGFWCQDAVLEVWLSFAVIELSALSMIDPWVREVHQEWSFYAKAGMTGAIDLTLDHFIFNTERKTWMVVLIQTVQERLLQFGDKVSVDLLNSFMPKSTQWVDAPPTLLFLTVGERLIQLIEGKLLTDESSPLNYL